MRAFMSDSAARTAYGALFLPRTQYAERAVVEARLILAETSPCTPDGTACTLSSGAAFFTDIPEMTPNERAILAAGIAGFIVDEVRQ